MSLSWKRLGSSIKSRVIDLSRPINPLQRAVRVKIGKRLERLTKRKLGASFVYNLPNVGYDMTIYCQRLRRRYLRIPSR